MAGDFAQKLIASIPDKPVDLFKLEFYRLSMNPQWIYLYAETCTYYVNTPWGACHSDKGGADLVDDWMISKDGLDEFRICGWGFIKGYLENSAIYIFETKAEALQEAVRNFDRWIEGDEKKIAQMKELRAAQWVSYLKEVL